jgi:sulfite exporter TauE/SafE
MCGGFVLALGSNNQGIWPGLVRQTSYALGRVFTYTAGGVAAGFLGWRLDRESAWLPGVHVALTITAGIVLIVQGLFATGLFDRLRLAKPKPGCMLPALFSGLLRATRPHSAFLAGTINGLLPCGLVYGYLALAASTGDLAHGALTMALFGLGTLPLMVVTGCGAQWLTFRWRGRLLRLAAWCVVLTGILCLARGAALLEDTVDASCPLCSGAP